MCIYTCRCARARAHVCTCVCVHSTYACMFSNCKVAIVFSIFFSFICHPLSLAQDSEDGIVPGKKTTKGKKRHLSGADAKSAKKRAMWRNPREGRQGLG